MKGLVNYGLNLSELDGGGLKPIDQMLTGPWTTVANIPNRSTMRRRSRACMKSWSDMSFQNITIGIMQTSTYMV
jgi:hypothetical protein